MRGTRRIVTPLLAVALAGGAVAHEVEFEDEELGGVEVRAESSCDSGSAQGFSCWNVDLLAWLPTAVFGGGSGNDIWGWTDRRSGREYALIGVRGGTGIVDVTEPTQPVYVGLLRTQTFASSWRDIKTYADHAFVVSEATGHGLQIFDLTTLADVAHPPVILTSTAHYAGFGSAHNLAIDEETGMAFAVGTQTCNGGLHMVDVTRPTEPVFAGCFSDDGYTHDTECVVYRGPDAEHRNREICFGSNEDTLTVVDVTSRDAPLMLSRTGYAGWGYTHQGWLTEDQRYFLLGDEFDERRFGHNARTYIWNVEDLDAPTLVGSYTSSRFSIDHNLFVVRNHVFQANYRSGLRVLRMGDLSRAEMTEVAFFDTFPGGQALSFSGAWGVYPFFESGVVVVSDINRGLFVLRPDLGAVPECSDGLDNDLDGRVDFPDDPGCESAAGANELPRNDVAIDVKPGNAGNVVNPSAHGVLPVAVLGSAGFDVETVNADSLRFGPGGAPPRHRRPRLRDVDGDGFTDLFAFYPLRQAGLSPDDEVACLRWEARDGTPYQGCDAIRSVPAHPAHPPHHGKKVKTARRPGWWSWLLR